MEIPAEMWSVFVRRPREMDKHSAGVVAVWGGSPRFANAPALAAMGARAAGAGLVRVFAPEQTRTALAAHVPEATFEGAPEVAEPPRADVVAAGMGLGTSPAAGSALESLLVSPASRRVVLDADALNILSAWRAGGRVFRPSPGQKIVMTPHAGEAARLLGRKPEDVAANRAASAAAIATLYGSTVVLKGPGTVVVSPDGGFRFVCKAGNPFMALGGMGDILSGAIAALWARMSRNAGETGCGRLRESEDGIAACAAAGAVWLHASAADSLVAGNPPIEPCASNLAARMASMRISLESGRTRPANPEPPPSEGGCR